MPFEPLGRVVLQLFDLAAGLEHPEVFFDTPAQGVPLQDARGVDGAGHLQRGQQEPLQRLGPGRRLFLAHMDDPQFDRRGAGAGQRHLLVAQCHLGDARRPAVLGGPVCWPSPAVRRAHARPRLFGLVDERFQQPGAIAVQTLAVVADRPGGPAQHVGGQVAARNAGAHQQPAQSQHPVQVGATARIVPPDPGVAGPQPPRTRREPDPAQPTMRRTHQIPQLRADKRPGAARVLVRHQRVPDPALLAGLHQHQGQTPNLVDRARHVHCRRHRMR